MPRFRNRQNDDGVAGGNCVLEDGSPGQYLWIDFNDARILVCRPLITG